MKISILSDSLGRPRPDIAISEKTEYEETYSGLLGGWLNNHSLNVNYIESLDTDEALFWNQRMVAFRRPDVVIYQIGINDCAPRLFQKKSQSMLFKNWVRRITKDKILNFLSNRRHFFTRTFHKVYVPLERFEKIFQS